MLGRGRTTISVFIAMMVLSLGSINVMADTVTEEPQVSLETDRTEYAGDDTIVEVVKLHNTTDSVLYDVKMQGNIPDGYQTDDGVKAPDQWSAEVPETAAGEASEVRVTFTRDGSGNMPAGDDDGQTSESGKKPENKPGDQNNKKQSVTNSGKDVRTGDNTNMIFWLMTGTVSLCLAVLAMKKRRGRNLLSLLLVLAMGQTLLPGTFLTAEAAEPDTEIKNGQTAEVSKTIMIDGKEVTLTAKITYHKKSIEESTDLSYDGYELKWEDQFEGESLNREDWNVELHDPGWVNNELQAYVDSSENIYIQDGSLVLKPVEKNAEGTVSYTSGRVNTQNKHDFKYGLFEARVKVPEGQGFLPAFWMMPTNENLYGQWPRCGEIDIMEVLGNKTDTSYGTIHYGNPHSESQGNYTLSEGDFSKEYHVFDVEWEPGKISWYVDGKRIHTESDWYSATEGQGEISYPAPFDQPFYIILNLAVGGSWPGNPDETTDIANSAYYIDYVKVYQKDEYDENVKKPIKEVILRDPDANGNYIVNGDFAEQEDLTDDKDWTFLTALGGEASASIENNEIKIAAKNEGTVDYSVQLVQADLLTEGNTYALSFTAEGEAGKSMKLKVAEQFFDAKLTGEESKYNYKLNLGVKPANTDVVFYIEEPGVFYIDNVRIEEDSLIKNGSFHAGFAGYEPYVDSSAAAAYVVDSLSEDNAADFSIDNTGDAAWKIQLKQNNIELEKDQWYKLTLDAKSSIARKLMFAIQRDGTVDDDWTPYSGEKIVDLGQDYGTYEILFQMTHETDPKSVLSISMGAVDGIQITEKHRICIDNINLEKTDAPAVSEQPTGENLLKNGDFSSGSDGWENAVTAPGEAAVSFEGGSAVYDITNVGSADWNVQLKQSGIILEQGSSYRICFKANSTQARMIRLAMLSPSYEWYGGQDIELAENEDKEITVDFTMEKTTDMNTTMVISMGIIEGKETPASKIALTDFSLVKIK